MHGRRSTRRGVERRTAGWGADGVGGGEVGQAGEVARVQGHLISYPAQTYTYPHLKERTHSIIGAPHLISYPAQTYTYPHLRA